VDKWVIVDLDGTLALIEHRLHFLKGERKEMHERVDPDWDGFNRACVSDPVNSKVRELVNHLAETGYKIIIMTGRNRKYARETVFWLKENHVRNHLLMMRDEKDYRPDTEVKLGMLKKMIDLDYITDKEQVLCVLEDREKVVDFWRSLGLLCLQVQKGLY
jgi:phosphoserine phosphatase